MYMSSGAVPSLKKVALWRLHEFRDWSYKAMAAMRALRSSFVEPGDLVWRTNAAESFELNRMDAPSLHTWLKSRMAGALLELVSNRGKVD
jgi:hypothetical protein